MLVGILFLFILMLMFSANDWRTKAKALDDSKKAVERIYKERVDRRSALIRNLTTELGANAPNSVPEDGILRLDESLLFERGKAELKPEGKRVLQRLSRELERQLPCYVSRAEGCAPILEAIYVEGHTDEKPDPTRVNGNWDLSSERAIAVYNVITANGKNSLATMQNARAGIGANGDGTGRRENLVGVSAYAATRLIDENVDDPNRRVDFRFILAAPTAAEIGRETGQ